MPLQEYQRVMEASLMVSQKLSQTHADFKTTFTKLASFSRAWHTPSSTDAINEAQALTTGDGPVLGSSLFPG